MPRCGGSVWTEIANEMPVRYSGSSIAVLAGFDSEEAEPIGFGYVLKNPVDTMPADDGSYVYGRLPGEV
jgi:hypothetical protein